ncbi:MAG: ATP-binding protein [Spirochaetaceae bacterium]|jgi:predicted AAA+ superfamily ATPase|nr:ATP-binding protein [Spirochaetaceae bacterium]
MMSVPPQGTLQRDEYLRRIKSAGGESACLLLTGIRRCGKTYLLRELILAIKAEGVDDSHIIYYDFENFVFPRAKNHKALKAQLASLVNAGEKYYIFLDEVQTFPGWEKAIIPFLTNDNISIYITSSGAEAGKISRKKNIGDKLTEIKVTPLSYSEYRRTQTPSERSDSHGLLQKASFIYEAQSIEFERYVARGGFPSTVFDTQLGAKTKLRDIYSAIIHHDVLEKSFIKNIELLEKIIKYIFENIGAEITVKSITKEFREEGYNKTLSGMSGMLKALEAALVIQKVRKINIITGKVQNAHSRYYAGDHALFHAISDNSDLAYYALLENIIVNELGRRGYEVYSGKIRRGFVDFAAQNSAKAVCVQTVVLDEDSDELIAEKESALEECAEFNGKPAARFMVYLDHKAPPKAASASENIIQIALPDFLAGTEY